MTRAWHSDVDDVPDGTEPYADLSSLFIGGIKSALTRFAGSTDPSSAALTPWDATDVGTQWLDTGATGTAVTPILWTWSRLTSGPTYGWSRDREPKIIMLTAPQDVIAAASIAADSAAADVNLATILDTAGVQDAGDNERVVRAVLLDVYLKPTAAVATGDKCWIELKAKGETAVWRVNGQVNGVPVRQRAWLACSSAEVIQRQYDTNVGACPFDVLVTIAGVMEMR